MSSTSPAENFRVGAGKAGYLLERDAVTFTDYFCKSVAVFDTELCGNLAAEYLMADVVDGAKELIVVIACFVKNVGTKLYFHVLFAGDEVHETGG